MSKIYDRDEYIKPGLGVRKDAKVGDIYRLESYSWYLQRYPELFEESKLTPGKPIFGIDGSFFQKCFSNFVGRITEIDEPVRKNRPRMIYLETEDGEGFHAYEPFLIPVNLKRFAKI